MTKNAKKEIPEYNVTLDRKGTDISSNAPVDKYMEEGHVCFTPDMDINDAVKILLKKKVTGAPVIDSDRKLLGFLSQKDCLKLAFEAKYYNNPPGPVEQYMSKEIIKVETGTDIFKVIELFIKNPFQSYPVTQNNELKGVITRYNTLKAVHEMQETNW